ETGSVPRPGVSDTGNDRERVSGPVELPSDSARANALRKRAVSANVVICIIDAARADHVGCYGYPRETTPNIDRLAGESVVFEQYFSPYPHTKPSTASLFTGQYPDTHLVADRRGMETHGFSMANVLESAGFQSVFLSSSPMASPGMGVGKDFEFVCGRDTTMSPGGGMRRGGRPRRMDGGWQGAGSWKTPEGLLEAFSGWLDADRTGRFFTYIHFLPPHLPYSAPEEMQDLFAGEKPPNAWQGKFEFREVAERQKTKPPPLKEWVNSYDANLRWADWAVGEIEKALRERDLLENTLLVVTSDHGEAFGEHGHTYHVDGVYDELVHVPLLVRFPGVERVTGRVGALTQTVDLLPTVLDLFRIPWPEDSIQGHSLLPLVSEDVEQVRDYVYATCDGEKRSYLVRDHDWALILWEGGKLRALYDLRNDPRQTRNVIEKLPAQATRMANAFRRFAGEQTSPPMEFVDPEAKRGELPDAPEVTLSEEQRRELEALGYVE
ncbi:MAG: sulfatase-like hydrolase/transferase, partial [Armatimonadetes bacterium]|nr:sulfatase-like hydrolase/transferase [Armatimonadota bacterium]